MNKTILIPESEKGKRIDVVLAELLGLPRAQVQKSIKEELVLRGELALKASYKVSGGETVTYSDVSMTTDDLVPYEMKLDILYEDAYLLVINKPAGLVVHPSFGHKDDTLVNALIARQGPLSDINGAFRPGIVHRLDKETSGLLVVCKNNDVHTKVAKLLKDRKMKRHYLALVVGALHEDAGVIKTYLARSKKNYQKMENTPSTGKLAITHFKVRARYEGYMLLDVELDTGRTHQIRAHMEFLNTPVVGDRLYGTNNLKLYKEGQLLHAARLVFPHPYTGQIIDVSAPLPAYYENVIKRLEKDL